MRSFFLIIVSFIVVLFSSCGEAMSEYKRSDVEFISMVPDQNGNVNITYRPLMESLYYSPGARVEQKEGRQKLKLIRCGIKDKCAVDIQAKSIGEGKLLISVNRQIPIDIVFKDGEKPVP